MSEYVRVIGGPLDGHMVEWRRSVVVVRSQLPNLLNTSGWAADDENRKEQVFRYARFSRPSGSFYAPHDWMWDQIERAMLDGYKGGR